MCLGRAAPTSTSELVSDAKHGLRYVSYGRGATRAAIGRGFCEPALPMLLLLPLLLLPLLRLESHEIVSKAFDESS